VPTQILRGPNADLGGPTHQRQFGLAFDQTLAFDNVVCWRHVQGPSRALPKLSKPAKGHRLCADQAKRAPIELELAQHLAERGRHTRRDPDVIDLESILMIIEVVGDQHARAIDRHHHRSMPTR